MPEAGIPLPSLHFSPRGEAKCVRGASGRGASRLARAGVLEQYVEHGKQAQRSHGGRIACLDRLVVRNAGLRIPIRSSILATMTVRGGQELEGKTGFRKMCTCGSVPRRQHSRRGGSPRRSDFPLSPRPGRCARGVGPHHCNVPISPALRGRRRSNVGGEGSCALWRDRG